MPWKEQKLPQRRNRIKGNLADFHRAWFSISGISVFRGMMKIKNTPTCTREVSQRRRETPPRGKKPLFRDFFLCYLSLANLQMLPEGSSSVAVGKAFLFCQSETQKQTKPKQKQNKTEKNKQGSEGRGRAFLQTHTLSLQMQIRGPWKDGLGQPCFGCSSPWELQSPPLWPSARKGTQPPESLVIS